MRTHGFQGLPGVSLTATAGPRGLFSLCPAHTARVPSVSAPTFLMTFTGRCTDQGTAGFLMTGLPLCEGIHMLQLGWFFHSVPFRATQRTR